MLKCSGSQCFRLRIVCATLSGKPLRIDDIRARDESPGLRDFEASFLRLIEKITNGCKIEINETGTSLRYKPGVIVGGALLQHDCCTSRSIGYYLEALVILGLFGKKPLSITLRGVTNDLLDPGVDVFRTVTLPLLKQLGIEEGLELKVPKRGARPLGGGEVVLRVPVLKQTMPPVNLTDEGMVCRIRGVAYSMKVSPQNTNRMVDGARGVLNKLLSDVFIFTDAVSGSSSGLSPGYGLTLVAETTSGCLISAECCATTGGEDYGQSLLSRGDRSAGSRIMSSQGTGRSDEGLNGGSRVGENEPLLVPEDIGSLAAHALLEEISRGGVVDGTHQSMVLLLAAIGPEEANQVRLGPLTPQAVRTLRTLRDFFGVTFNMKAERESKTIFLTCIGAGIKNTSKKVT
ncbi:hypothetical protein CEUSTIGMA_g13117.t1 [Chlamydomonas eustigma]|uniref:RNA 3'-terminal phosphate cyclase domain-containing protein n=1 Tax=Chlamydomonas eustigma TaxID=1157962 RepID=A0A250XRR4_9CHLO|nr:hypothetical protein CEUSTIGMA_g13117.t1 [Chlamydomonas eustigma]|eukprot:GAX85703.1 hypothetical protein CEUSTIGMA_g13117.t1 [Chlamydomonas eustigma]